MPFKYLTLEKVKNNLEFGEEISPLPSDEKLTFLINRLETIFEYWIGRSLYPTLYSEIVKTNRRGFTTVRYYPILSIVKIFQIHDSRIIQTPEAESAKAIDPLSAGLAEYDRHTTSPYRDSEYGIQTGVVCGHVEVTYWAGYDPVPEMVEECLLFAMTGIIKQGGINHLLSPIKQVTSQSLPGGLSQSLKISDFREGENSYMDFYFLPLKKFKRDLKF